MLEFGKIVVLHQDMLTALQNGQGAQDAQGDALIQPAVNDAGIAAGVHGIALIRPSITGAGIAADMHIQNPVWAADVM